MKRRLFNFDKEFGIMRNWEFNTFKKLIGNESSAVLNYEKRSITYIASKFLVGYMQ